MSTQYFETYIEMKDKEAEARLERFVDCVKRSDFYGISQLNVAEHLDMDEIDDHFIDVNAFVKRDDHYAFSFEGFCSLEPIDITDFLFALGATRLEASIFNSQVGEHSFVLDDEELDFYDEAEWQWLKNPEVEWDDAFVVITGTFADGTRDDVAQRVEDLGGTVQSSVNGKTTLLLVGDKPGASKMTKAEKLGVRIMDEEEFDDHG